MKTWRARYLREQSKLIFYINLSDFLFIFISLYIDFKFSFNSPSIKKNKTSLLPDKKLLRRLDIDIGKDDNENWSRSLKREEHPNVQRDIFWKYLTVHANHWYIFYRFYLFYFLFILLYTDISFNKQPDLFVWFLSFKLMFKCYPIFLLEYIYK